MAEENKLLVIICSVLLILAILGGTLGYKLKQNDNSAIDKKIATANQGLWAEIVGLKDTVTYAIVEIKDALTLESQSRKAYDNKLQAQIDELSDKIASMEIKQQIEDVQMPTGSFQYVDSSWTCDGDKTSEHPTSCHLIE